MISKLLCETLQVLLEVLIDLGCLRKRIRRKHEIYCTAIVRSGVKLKVYFGSRWCPYKSTAHIVFKFRSGPSPTWPLLPYRWILGI